MQINATTQEFVAGSRRAAHCLGKPCRKCGLPIKAGERVLSKNNRSKSRAKTRYYHKECWVRLLQ